MNIDTVQMDPRIARIHYNDYRKKCRENRLHREQERRLRAAELGKELRQVQIEKSRMELEDQELLKAYRALLRAGARLINLPTVINKGGLTDKEKLPALACVRADSKTCYFSCSSPRFQAEGTQAKWSERDVEIRKWPTGITDLEWRKRSQYPITARALVPQVPPHLRPENLKDYFILWEAEWKAVAPVDPILLSRVNKDMYVIIAQWNLSELEQRLLENRL
jgi:hypothetical protein